MGSKFTRFKESNYNQKAVKAILIIQQSYRCYRARTELRYKALWKVLDTMEVSGEDDQLRVSIFFKDLLASIPKEHKRTRSLIHFELDMVASSLGLDNDNNIDQFKKYRIHFPLNDFQFHQLFQVFKEKHTLPFIWLYSILRSGCIKVRLMPNVNHVSIKSSRRVIICGSLHGNLQNLLMLFKINGMPSSKNIYVFNGGLVDLGPNSCEVIALVLASLLEFPNAVFINRGAHEDPIMNDYFGFKDEIASKYPKEKRIVWTLIKDLYRWLPLATVIDNKVYVVHGGFSVNTRLNSLEAIPRHLYISVLCPTTRFLNKTHWKMIYDMLWSEPFPENQKKSQQHHARRVKKEPFDEVSTTKFLENHNLNLVIRSQKCLQEGFKKHHSDRVISVSSNSDLYGAESSKAAFVVFKKHGVQCHFLNKDKKSKKNQKTLKEKTDELEVTTLDLLTNYLAPKATELKQAFRDYDKKFTGSITFGQWCHCLTKVTKMKLPWQIWSSAYLNQRQEIHKSNKKKRNKSFLATRKDNMAFTDHIQYQSTLKVLHEHRAPTIFYSVSKRNCVSSNKTLMKFCFKLLDYRSHGVTSMEEFAVFCQLLETHFPHLFEKSYLLSVVKKMAGEKKQTISFSEFMEIFRSWEASKFSSNS